MSEYLIQGASLALKRLRRCIYNSSVILSFFQIVIIYNPLALKKAGDFLFLERNVF